MGALAGLLAMQSTLGLLHQVRTPSRTTLW
jgi:hypothetical protein